MKGLGVMISEYMWGWREKPNEQDLVAIKEATIRSVFVDDDQLTINFDNDYQVIVSDQGQSCCEHRYMRCDDDLSYYVGAQLTGIETADASSEVGEYDDCTECQFLVVSTTRGDFRLANYNEHNGYYGGFSVHVQIKRPNTTGENW